jgi:hypothetical protein
MIKILLLFLTIALAEFNQTEWMLAVEGLLAEVAVGALKEEFTPSYVSQRTKESCLYRQMRRFRASVAAAIASSDGDEVLVCPSDAYISEDAINRVAEEFRKRTFIVRVVADECWKRKGLLIRIPLPTK